MESDFRYAAAAIKEFDMEPIQKLQGHREDAQCCPIYSDDGKWPGAAAAE